MTTKAAKPLEFHEVTLLIVAAAIVMVGFTEVVKYRSYNPTVLNSLPATKIRCDDSAVKGWCAGKHMTVKQWEGMQK